MFLPPEYDSQEIIENGPEMWLNEITYIKDLIHEQSKDNSTLRFLEWGSGNGTRFFAKYMLDQGLDFEWHAIEHFYPWHDKVKEMIAEDNLQEVVTLHLVCPTNETDKIKQEQSDMREYYEYPASLGHKFNIILVDSRKRKECLEAATKLLAEGGRVILHDAERVEYHDGFDCYEQGGFVTTNNSPNSQGGIQKMWVGSRPRT